MVWNVDCLDLVNALGKERYKFHRYGSSLIDIHLLLSRDWDVNIRHVPREGNEPADRLAGMGASLQCYVTDRCPS